MKALQITYPMIDDLYLFLNDRHTLRKVIVLSHLAGKFLQFGIGYRLRPAVGYKYTEQGDRSADDRYYYAFGHFAYSSQPEGYSAGDHTFPSISER